MPKTSTSETVVMDANVVSEGQPPTQLEPSTEEEVSDIIMKSPSESCDLPPSYLLKQVLEHLLPLITSTIDTSLIECMTALYFRNTDARPLLKKVNVKKTCRKTTKQCLTCVENT